MVFVNFYSIFIYFLLSLTPEGEIKIRIQTVPTGLQQELGVVHAHGATICIQPK